METHVRYRCDYGFFVSWFCRADSCNICIEKFYHRAICIMVQGIHPCTADASIRQKRIPSFPYGGSPQIYTIEPAWEFLLENEIISQLFHFIFSKCHAQKWSTNESTPYFVGILFQTFLELTDQPFLISIQSKFQGNNVRGLGIQCKSSCSCKILIQNRVPNLPCQFLILFCLFFISQFSRSLCSQRN